MLQELRKICSISLLAVLLQTFSVQALAFNYGTDKIRGVSLGGWLLLEPFITPQIFLDTKDDNVIDEYTYGLKYGSAGAAARLKSHWDTFITETDIATIKSYGLNHVRIPIGYWSLNKLPSEPYAVGAYPYFKKAVGWCQKYGLKVIIDLHGAPGSQNGFDNSGQRGPILWHTNSTNVERTRQALKILIDDFIVPTTYRDTVTSIQPINEPAGFAGDAVLSVAKQYYYDSYGAIRWPFGTSAQSDTLLSLHDAFQDPATYWSGFMPSSGWSNVALDTHYYSIFTSDQLKWSNQQRIDGICSFTKSMTQGSLWTFTGEWTPAITDCAGSRFILGSRGSSIYEGTSGGTAIGSCANMTGSGANFSPEMKTFMRQYWETQANVYEKGIGWVQWTWKTGGPDEWSYQAGVKYGWIPKNPTERKYGDLCATKLPIVSTTTTSTTSTSKSTSTSVTSKPTTTTGISTTKLTTATTSKATTTAKSTSITTKTTSTTSKPTSTTKASTATTEVSTTTKLTTTSKTSTTTKPTTTSKAATMTTTSKSSTISTSKTSTSTSKASTATPSVSSVALAKGRGTLISTRTSSSTSSTQPTVVLAKMRGV